MSFLKICNPEEQKLRLNPSLHHISVLKEIEDQNPKWLLFLHYMYYPVPDENPFFLIPDNLRENKILKTLKLKTEDKPQGLNEAADFILSIYETPVIRMHKSISAAIDKMSEYIRNIEMTPDNIKIIKDTVKDFDKLLENYKKSSKEFYEEIRNFGKTTGNKQRSYDL